MKTTLKENFFDLDEGTWDGVLTEEEHDTVLQAINEERVATVLSRELVVDGGETDYYNVEIAGVVIPGLHGVHIDNIKQFQKTATMQMVVEVHVDDYRAEEFDHEELELLIKQAIAEKLRATGRTKVVVSNVMFETVI